ncbi:MAG: 2-oxoacid:acceptor oxidoreductase family protein [Arenicellales bacterium]|jgi:pyruvate ferredoxin oxidoreductase gamma subunit
MYRIRFHGRGGQGMKTASRILGTAFFLAGYEVQDAPRYGAERRGAPIFAYVRADKAPINERGIINHPDLVIVADESLVPVPAAGVLAGITENTLMLINSSEKEQTWKARLNHSGTILTLPVATGGVEKADLPFAGAACAGAAACLTGVITEAVLKQAIESELAELGAEVVEKNLNNALDAYQAMLPHAGEVEEGSQVSADSYQLPDWIDLPFDDARISAPAIHAAATSVMVKTGLWRTQRPIIDYDHCKGCWWVCSSYCPDGAINVVDARPIIDYDHCKGCMVCVAQCPPHAIEAIPEKQAQAADEQARLAAIGGPA